MVTPLKRRVDDKFSYLPILDSNGIVDISDTGVQSSINELEETLTKEEAKQTFAADILESSFADVSRGNEHFQYLSKVNNEPNIHCFSSKYNACIVQIAPVMVIKFLPLANTSKS